MDRVLVLLIIGFGGDLFVQRVFHNVTGNKMRLNEEKVVFEKVKMNNVCDFSISNVKKYIQIKDTNITSLLVKKFYMYQNFDTYPVVDELGENKYEVLKNKKKELIFYQIGISKYQGLSLVFVYGHDLTNVFRDKNKKATLKNYNSFSKELFLLITKDKYIKSIFNISSCIAGLSFGSHTDFLINGNKIQQIHITDYTDVISDEEEPDLVRNFIFNSDGYFKEIQDTTKHSK